jgi:hypothetical protein
LAKERKNNRGRKKEVPSQKVDLGEVEKLAELGFTDVEIASWFGLSERTITNYKKDPEFLAVLKRGKMNADREVLRSLYKNATVKNNVTAQIFWLKNRQPERWRERHELNIQEERPEVNDNILERAVKYLAGSKGKAARN